MKTVEALQKEMKLLERKFHSSDTKKAGKNRARKRIVFIQERIILIEQGLSHDTAVAQAKKVRDRYLREKAEFYETHTREVDGKMVRDKNVLSRFHNNGARQMWRQIQTFKFLLSA